MKVQYLVRNNNDEVVLWGVSLAEASMFIEENSEQAPFEVHEIEDDNPFSQPRYLN